MRAESDKMSQLKQDAIQGHREEILNELILGPKRTRAIVKAINAPRWSIEKELRLLVDLGEIIRVRKGLYKLNEFQVNPRTEADNIETINRVLNSYDVVLDQLRTPGVDIERLLPVLTAFKSTAVTVDQLMKRWYLVHRGYDNNARQAQEDAKAKARKVEKEETASAPPEERVVVVGEYDNVMKELWENLPESEQDKKTV